MNKKVILLDKSNDAVKLVEATVPWFCLECGDTMGEPTLHKFAYEGKEMACHVWNNNCGHKPKHADYIEKFANTQTESPAIPEISKPVGRMTTREVFQHLAGKHGLNLREGQVQLSEKIDEVIRSGGFMAAEAGTGTGKSNAYIVPMLLSNKKFTISTATKTLQDQVFLKDVQNMQSSLGTRKQVVVYKGAGNYLCRYNLNDYAFIRPELKEEVEKIGQWYDKNPVGDLNDFNEETPIPKASISVDLETCDPLKCKFAATCGWVNLKKRVKDADIVVTNHHLTLLSKDCREERFIVFDEAHELAKVAQSVLLLEFSDRRIRADIENLMKYNSTLLMSAGLTKNDLQGFINGLNQVALKVLKTPEDKYLADEKLFESMHISSNIIEMINNYLDTAPFDNFALRLRSVLKLANFAHVHNTVKDGVVKYTEKTDEGKNIIYRICYQYIGEELKNRLWKNDKILGSVLLSATMRYDGRYDYSLNKLGLDRATTKTFTFQSPFDYDKQSALYIPDDMPAYTDGNYRDAVSRQVYNIVEKMNGRTLVLFTSYQRMADTFEDLNGLLPYTMLMQGQDNLSVTAIRDMFMNDTHSVLFATKSFWTGVDIPGESLSCVIIDKIPFPQLGDPVTQKVTENLMDPVINYLVPESALELCQGVGRLIRKEDDKGIVALLDNRMLTKKYAKKIFGTLPNMHFVTNLDEAVDWVYGK